MTAAGIDAAAAVVLLVVAGLPVGYVVVRTWFAASVLAPLVSALSATAAVIAMLIFGGQLVPWLVVAFSGQYVVAALVLARDRLLSARPPRHRLLHSRLLRFGLPRWRREPLPFGTWAEAPWLLLPLLPPCLSVLRPPTQWDANSIWWLHAGYFASGADFARQAIANPVNGFSHPSYPPLGSAPVAAVWALFGRGDLYQAQFVSAALSLSAMALLTWCVRWATAAAPAAISRCAAVVTGLSTWGVSWWSVTGGLTDALWSCLLVAAAVLLLVAPGSLPRPGLPVLLLAAAALTKNEGLATTVVLAVLATIRHRRTLRRVAPVWLAVAAGLGWALLARHLGAPSEAASGSRLPGLLRGDPATLHRIGPTLAALWQLVGPLVATALVLAVLGALLLRDRRRLLGLGSDGWLWALSALYAAVLLTTYAASSYDLSWYLATSADRTVRPLAQLAVVSAVCWGAAAGTGGWRSGGGGRPATVPGHGDARPVAPRREPAGVAEPVPAARR